MVASEPKLLLQLLEFGLDLLPEGFLGHLLALLHDDRDGLLPVEKFAVKVDDQDPCARQPWRTSLTDEGSLGLTCEISSPRQDKMR